MRRTLFVLIVVLLSCAGVALTYAGSTWWGGMLAFGDQPKEHD